MDIPNCEIRAMRESEIPQVLALWKETTYPEGNYSIDTWFEVDREGICVAVTDNGDVIGSCCAILNQEDILHVGLYAVRKQYRGKGIGKQVWDACLKHIGERNAVVNAVPGKLEVYRDIGGFPIEEAGWHSIYYEAENINSSALLKEAVGIDVRSINNEGDIQLILEYDQNLIGYSREKGVRLTLKEADSVSYIAVSKEGKCLGYGCYKLTCQQSGMVGPLYADDQDIAEVLLRRMIESMPEVKVFVMMIINTNKGAQAILDKLQVNAEKMEAPRLYRKHKIDIDMGKIFGQFNLNFCPY